MIEKIIIDVCCGLSLISIILYLSANKHENNLKFARATYFAATAGVITVSALLLYHILNYNFTFSYIYAYSSRELPPFLLVSTFFAGQEGSFLLWALFQALLGLPLLYSLRKNGYEAPVLAIHSLSLFFLLFLLIFKSPFNYIWETFAHLGVEPGYLPQNGRGLNPILENYWIAIHPPVLFLGFAALSVPFSFAVASLIKNEFNDWVVPVRKWALTATGILGLGLILGGFWAYETLGWGGFWGWDPVENASLLPWIVAVAFIHTSLIKKRTENLIKTNYLMAIVAYLLVIYSTYLTRSGVLSDISVHSFVNPGSIVNDILLAFLSVFTLLGILPLVYKFNLLSKQINRLPLLSKEFVLTVGILLLLASTLIIFIGTNLPVFFAIAGKKISSVDISFYNKWNLPLIIIVQIIMPFTTFLNWKRNDFLKNPKIVIIIAVSSLLLTLLFIAYGISDIVVLLCLYSSIFCLLSSLLPIFTNFGKNLGTIGSYLAHSGLAVFFIGVIISGANAVTSSVKMEQGEQVKSGDYKLVFKDKTQIEKEKQDRDKFEYNIFISNEKELSDTLKPIVYWSSFNEYKSPFFEPDILSSFSKDIYVSPKSIGNNTDAPELKLKVNQTQKMPLDSSKTMTLLAFDASQVKMAEDKEHTVLGAILEISSGGKIYYDTLHALVNLQTEEFIPYWKQLQDNKVKMGLTSVIPNPNISETEAVITFAKEEFIVDLTIKPLIILVWFGSFVALAGFFIALFYPTKKEE